MDVFEVLNQKFNLCKQVDSLNEMLFIEKPLHDFVDYSFANVFEQNLLRTWDYSNGYISFKDLLLDLDIYNPISKAPKKLSIERDALLCLQLLINIIAYARNHLDAFMDYRWDQHKFFSEVNHKISFILDKSAMKVIRHSKENYLMLAPVDEKLRAVAESTDVDTAVLLYEYASPLLKGKPVEKREVLRQLASRIETIALTYKKIYSSGLGYSIFNNLTTLLNNFEIRHSNMEPKNEKNFKAELHSYTAKDWEEIYDTTYQLILDALLIDNYKHTHEPIIEKHKQRIGLI